MGYYCKNLYKCLKENIYLYFSLLLLLVRQGIQKSLDLCCP